MTEADLTRTAGQRLRTAREARGLSQRELALLTDGAVLDGRISNFEQGKRCPSVEAACALADALGNVSAAHLLCVDDLEEGFSAEEMGLLDRFRAADETGRRNILAIAEGQARLS